MSEPGARPDRSAAGERLRVALVSDCYLPTMGGIEVQAHDLARHLQAAGHEVVVITSAAGPDEMDGIRIRRLEMPATNVRLPLAPFAVPLAPSTFRQLAEAIDEEEPDVVHFHGGVGSPLAFIGASNTQRCGIPSVITTHCLWSWATPAFRAVERRYHWTRWPVVLSAVSEEAAAPVRRIAGPGVDVAILPNGIDRAAWQVERAERDPEVFTVVSVMRLAPRKRPMQLLRILRDVHDQLAGHRRLRAVIVGEGPERRSMERYLAAHHLSGVVELTGRLDHEAIRDLYRTADAFVAPANLESFGIAALEARCAGVPVVAKAATGVREFVEHGREGLLATDDRDLAHQLVRLAADVELAEAMAKHNAATAPEMEWSEVTERNVAVYRRAIETMGDLGPPRRPARSVH